MRNLLAVDRKSSGGCTSRVVLIDAPAGSAIRFHNEDLESPDSSSKFSERCYNVLRRVPPGRVTSYAEIAKAIGTKAYRAVGQAMHRNPYAPTVPCHRVVRSDGSIGGYAWGSDQFALLESEGVIVRDGTIHNLKDVFYPLS